MPKVEYTKTALEHIYKKSDYRTLEEFEEPLRDFMESIYVTNAVVQKRGNFLRVDLIK